MFTWHTTAHTTLHRRIYLHTCTDNVWELTPVQKAAEWVDQVAIKLLQDYQTSAFIDIALQQTDLKGIPYTQKVFLSTNFCHFR